jgi:hypothetical protein
MAPQVRCSFFFGVQLVEMLLDKGRLDDEQAKHGMATIRAMAFALDTWAMLPFHPLKGRICLFHQQLIASKKLGRVHDLR